MDDNDFQSVLHSLSPIMFINVINLTLWNANWCYSFWATYLIFVLSIFFPTTSLIFIEFCKVFHHLICDRMKQKASTTSHPYDGCFEILNLLNVSNCTIFTFCDVLHETKQKTQTNSWECAVLTGNQSSLRLILPAVKKSYEKNVLCINKSVFTCTCNCNLW